MGTSQSISPGVSGDPNWGQTSSSVLAMANRIEKEIQNPDLVAKQSYNIKRSNSFKNILNKYINAAGGRHNISLGKSSKGGKAAVSTAKSLGNILNLVSRGEFAGYAQERGIDDFANKSKSEIIHFLLEDICGPTTNFDEGAAKSALDKLLNKLFENADMGKDIEAIFQDNIKNFGIESILIDFFGTYIFEHLFQPIQEHLFDSKGEELCNKTMDEIELFITSELNVIHSTTNISSINWNNDNERTNLITKIFNNVLTVFDNE